jgi:hypothetical protein
MQLPRRFQPCLVQGQPDRSIAVVRQDEAQLRLVVVADRKIA